MVSVPNPGVAPSTDPPNDDQPVIHVTKERVERPLLAPDVELVGRVQDSAFKEEQWLICFEESNYIQSTPLLYHVLLFADGTRTNEEIAQAIVSETSIEVTGEDVEWLVQNRLIPSGLLDLGTEDLGEGPRPAETPVLGLRWRIPLFPYAWTVPVVDALKHLYWPPLMVAVVLAAIGINVWLFIDASVIQSAQSVMFRPELVLILFVLDTASTLFHELGHAAALRRANVRYGWIGFALYVIFPVFYTDVTHIYRLNRGERIRVDLGGMYFELIMMVLFFGGYLITGDGIFLIAIVLTTMSFLQQFTPFLRFDGYYTVADVMGINEPLSLVKPFLRDRIPWPRGRQKSLPDMRLGSKIAFSLYLTAVIAFLSYPLFIGAFAGREFAATLFESGRYLWNQSVNAWSNGEILLGITATLQLFLWALIPLALSLFTLTLARHFWKGGRALARALSGLLRQRIAQSSQSKRIAIVALSLVVFVLISVGTAVGMNLPLPWAGSAQPQASESTGNNAVPVTGPTTNAGITEGDQQETSTTVPQSSVSETEAEDATAPVDPKPSDEQAAPTADNQPGGWNDWAVGESGGRLLPLSKPDRADAQVPDTPEEITTHTIEEGESLWEIAERYGTTVEELVALNDISNPDIIFAGDTLEIPR